MSTPYWFDGITLPKLHVSICVSGALNYPANAFVLDGTSLLDGTYLLTSGQWLDITDDVSSIIIERGPDSDFDQAPPGSCILVLDDTLGNYYPENLNGLYVTGGTQTTVPEVRAGIGVAKSDVSVASLQTVLPSSYTAGSDYLVLDFIFSGADTATQDTNLVAAGWTQAAGSPVKSSFGQLWRYYKLAGASETAPLLTFSTTARIVAHITAVSGSSGVGQSSSAADSSSDTDGVDAPSITVSHRSTIVAAQGERVAVSPMADEIPGSNYTTRLITQNVVSSGGGNTLGLHSREDLASGTYGGETFAPDIAARDTLIVTEFKASVGVGNISQIEFGLPVRVQAEWDGVLYDRFYGEVTKIFNDLGFEPSAAFTCADGLERLGRTRLGNNIAMVDGEYTGQRIGKLADAAGWATNLRALDRGYSQLGKWPSTDYVLPLMQQVARTEFGLLFVDGAGRLVFYDRYRQAFATRSTTVQATFDNTVELQSLDTDRDRESVANDWHIRRNATNDDDDPIEQVATDQTSVEKYGGTFSGPSGSGELLRGDEESLAMAQTLAQRFKDARTLVGNITIDAAALGLWSTLLPLGLLDRIALARTNPPHSLSRELLIQKFREEITVDGGPDGTPSWTFTFGTTTPLPAPSLFKLDGTSVLNGTVPLNW